MGNSSQLAALFAHMRPDAAKSLLDNAFDSFYFDNSREETWDELSPESRLAILCEFLTQGGVNGDVVRDLFQTLNANVGAEEWLKRTLSAE
jgi:hypothetical protein